MTLGYIPDTLINKSLSTCEKMQDYHKLLGCILKSFKEAQNLPLIWEFNLCGKRVKKALKIPVLYVIGDTEGHDKLCGKFLSRNKTTNCICRYCNVPFDSTDDPFYKGSYWRKSIIEKLCKSRDEERLRTMSMYCIDNTWHEIKFCDTIRGINGSTPAETLHCLQQGIFEYVISALFDQKKEKKGVVKKKEEPLNKKRKGVGPNVSTEVDVENDNKQYYNPRNHQFTGFSVLPKSEIGNFESLCQHYGRLLQRQSDRELPRTYFYSKYNSTAKKSGHEMAGILLVFLSIFCCNEGITSLMLLFGDVRFSAFVHLFELMLMLENFCKTESHDQQDVKEFKKGIPILLNTLKTTINREDGNGMKIIKFHLITHFADDILRYGS
jgi:hypothetical protein